MLDVVVQVVEQGESDNLAKYSADDFFLVAKKAKDPSHENHFLE